QIGGVGRGQVKVQDDAAEGHQQVQFVAVNSLLLGGDLAKGGPIGIPVPRRTGDEVELHHGDRETVEAALAILSQIQQPQRQLPEQLEGPHQLTATAVEAALTGLPGKEVTVVAEVAEQFGFEVPAPALADQGQGEQFTVGAFWGRPRPAEQGSDLLVEVIDDDVHPGAKVLEAV